MWMQMHLICVLASLSAINTQPPPLSETLYPPLLIPTYDLSQWSSYSHEPSPSIPSYLQSVLDKYVDTEHQPHSTE